MEKCVLLVDDNDKVRALLRSVLESAGYRVVEARDGLDGLTKAKRRVFDGFVIDYLMPVMDGLTLIKGLKEMPHYAKQQMILLSTDNGVQFVAKVAAADHIDVLYKPVGQGQLQNLLAQHLNLAMAS